MHNKDTHTGPSFSLANRLGRLVWNFTDLLVFKYTPKPLHFWRAFVLKCFGAKVGKGVHVYPKVNIWAPWNLVLKDGCGIANGAILYSQDIITIGEKAVISQGAHICAGTHDYNTKGFILITKPITIGDHAWVATEAFLHPGVKIGEGCVIGARSVVNKHMPDWMVCAGNPCVPLKARKNIFEENA